MIQPEKVCGQPNKKVENFYVLCYSYALCEGQGLVRMSAKEIYKNGPRTFKELPHPERLKKLSLWSLEERRVRTDLIEVYKGIHGLSALPFDALFDNSGRTRGHSLKLRKHEALLLLREWFQHGIV